MSEQDKKIEVDGITPIICVNLPPGISPKLAKNKQAKMRKLTHNNCFPEELLMCPMREAIMYR